LLFVGEEFSSFSWIFRELTGKRHRFFMQREVVASSLAAARQRADP
jgi:hypothetical protein